MIITIEQYFAGKPHSQAQEANAASLLPLVNKLLADAVAEGVKLYINDRTGSLVGGSGNGGFRTPDCPIGAPNSAHKQGQAVDIYDPHNELDEWITDQLLVHHGLYREHPSATNTWCHLTTRAPGSGKRTFMP